MKYVRFTGGNGFVGCDYEEYREYDDDTPEFVIENDSLEICEENAESYAYQRFGWDEDYSDEDYDEYLEDCYCDWTYISKEEFIESSQE